MEGAFLKVLYGHLTLDVFLHKAGQTALSQISPSDFIFPDLPPSIAMSFCILNPELL